MSLHGLFESLPPFHFDADTDPDFHFDADPDQASQNETDPRDPDPQK